MNMICEKKIFPQNKIKMEDPRKIARYRFATYVFPSQNVRQGFIPLTRQSMLQANQVLSAPDSTYKCIHIVQFLRVATLQELNELPERTIQLAPQNIHQLEATYKELDHVTRCIVSLESPFYRSGTAFEILRGSGVGRIPFPKDKCTDFVDLVGFDRLAQIADFRIFYSLLFNPDRLITLRWATLAMQRFMLIYEGIVFPQLTTLQFTGMQRDTDDQSAINLNHLRRSITKVQFPAVNSVSFMCTFVYIEGTHVYTSGLIDFTLFWNWLSTEFGPKLQSLIIRPMDEASDGRIYEAGEDQQVNWTFPALKRLKINNFFTPWDHEDEDAEPLPVAYGFIQLLRRLRMPMLEELEFSDYMATWYLERDDVNDTLARQAIQARYKETREYLNRNCRRLRKIAIGNQLEEWSVNMEKWLNHQFDTHQQIYTLLAPYGRTRTPLLPEFMPRLFGLLDDMDVFTDREHG